LVNFKDFLPYHPVLYSVHFSGMLL
jgi:hypothetical protein